MKHVLRSKKTRSIVAFATLIIACGVAVTWYLWSQQQAAWEREVIKKTDVADMSELSNEDLNSRSKAIFGKSVDELAEGDVASGEGIATVEEAAKILVAAGKTDEGIAAFKRAESNQGEKVNQDLYRNYRNALDEAGRHNEATDLLRRELELLKNEIPNDEVAILRVESQITEREEYYK